MEQITYPIANSTALILEKIFWLGIGGFLGLAIITSVLRGFDEIKNKEKRVLAYRLDNLAKKAIQQNNDSK